MCPSFIEGFSHSIVHIVNSCPIVMSACTCPLKRSPLLIKLEQWALDFANLPLLCVASRD